MSNVAVAERPASVTVAPGVTVTAAMTPTERFNAIAQAAGAPTVAPTIAAPQFHTPATLQRFAQGDAEARSAAPAVQREDGSSGAPAHAGMVAPSPEELAAANSGDPLAAFDAEMRARGVQRPLEEQQAEAERFQVDDRTGVRVDTHALERAHELYRSIPAAERESARGEYEQTLADILAGKLGLADMEDVPGAGQPRDAQGRYAPSQAAAAQPQYTVKQMEEEHAKVADADGWIPLARVGKWALSGYTLKQYIPDQRLNPAAFGMLANARKAGVSQAQVDAFLENQMRADGWIP